jgi:hypothetical protein
MNEANERGASARFMSAVESEGGAMHGHEEFSCVAVRRIWPGQIDRVPGLFEVV